MAENELTSVILNDLRSQREWQQQTTELLREISQRLTKVESFVDTISDKQAKQDTTLEELEELKNKGEGIRQAAGYIAAAIPGVVALIKTFI